MTLDLAALRAQRCVAIVRAGTTEHLVAVAHALAESGIRILEFPLTTPGVLEVLPQIREKLGPDVLVGAGTVTSVAEAQAAAGAGAEYLVAPNVDPEVLAWAGAAGLPVLAGALTPTEIVTAHRGGALAVKLFPASLGGPGYLRELVRGPFPQIPLIPTGGVGLQNAAEYLAAGAVACGMGGALVGSAADGGSLDELRERARTFRAAIG